MAKSITTGPLRRSLITVEVAAFHIALICVLGGIFGNFPWGIFTLGPAFVWAWIVGGVLQLCVAFSMARLSAAYPLTGGCYQWLRALGRERLAWFTGYILLVGYVAAIADGDMGLAGSLLSFAGIANPSSAALSIAALGCLVVQTLLTIVSISRVARANLVTTAVQVVMIVTIVVALAIVGIQQPAGILLQASGIAVHPHMPKFLLMLMIPVWTITGFDTPVNFADETLDPRRAIPRALLLATSGTLVLGTALIAVPLLALPSALASSSTISLSQVLTARLGAGFSNLSNVAVLLALFFLPVVVLLVAARMLWAQARAGAWPAGSTLARLDRRGVPMSATLLCALVAAVFCLGWPVLYGLGTVWPALWSLAYALTIGASLATKAKERSKQGWNGSRWIVANDLLAVGWCAFLVVLLPLFDALHAVPLFIIIVLIGIVARYTGAGSRVAHPPDVEWVSDVSQSPGP